MLKWPSLASDDAGSAPQRHSLIVVSVSARHCFEGQRYPTVKLTAIIWFREHSVSVLKKNVLRGYLLLQASHMDDHICSIRKVYSDCMFSLFTLRIGEYCIKSRPKDNSTKQNNSISLKKVLLLPHT